MEDSTVMYGIYNSQTLEKLITTIHKMHNSTTPNEKLFAGKLDSWYIWYLTKDAVGHYAINSLLYLRTLREKYVKMYEEFINQLCMYAKAIRILSKGYLPILPFPPSELQEILGKVKKSYLDYKFRLWHSHKKTTFVFWYEISYLWNWQR